MTYKEQHPKLATKTHFSTFKEKDYPYNSSQSKIVLTYTLNWKIILNFIHQIHIHTSYKNIKILFIS